MNQPEPPHRERLLTLLGHMCDELDELGRSCASTEGHIEQLRLGQHELANGLQRLLDLPAVLERIERKLDELREGQRFLAAKIDLVQDQVVDGFRAQGARVEKLELRDAGRYSHGKRVDETR